MNKRGRIFLIVVLCLFIGGTIISLMLQRNIEEMYFDKIPEEVKKLGIDAVNYYIESDYEAVKDLFVDELKQQEDVDEFMVNVSNYLSDSGTLKNIKIFGYYINIMNGENIQTIVMELEYQKKIIQYTFEVAKIGNEYKLLRTDFTLLEDSLYNSNRFRLFGKGVLNYVIILFIIAIFIFSIITAAVSFSTKEKGSILWSIFALSGIGLFHFVWNTGEWGVNLISIGIPSVLISRGSSVSSLILSMRFPLGALLYWIIRHGSIKASGAKNGSDAKIS